MRYRRVRVLLCVLGLSLAAAPAALADRTADLVFEDPAVAPGKAGDANQVIATWRSLGADWVRVQAFWNALSPSPFSKRKPAGFNVANPNDPRYNWGDLDRAIQRVRANGMRVQLTVHQFNPVWASSEPRKGRQGWKPSPRLYAQFATAVARRYRAQVDRYLEGNEPNQKVFMTPQTQCKRISRKRVCERTAANIYRELSRLAYPAIKRADPGAQVLLGELAPIGAIGKTAGNLAPLAFIRAMGCLDDRYRRIRVGACRRFKATRADGFGYHPYQVRERPNQPQRNPNLAKLGDLKRLLRVLDRVTRGRRIIAPRRKFNLYLTEYGYETNPPDARNGVSPDLQRRYLQQAAYIAWSTPRVKQFSQYLWRDDPARKGRLIGFQTGLNFGDGRPKPALAAFPHPFFIDTKRGRRRAVIWGQVRPGGGTSVRVLQQRGAGAFTQLAAQNTDSRGYFSLRRSLPANSNYRFEYALNGQVRTSDTFHVR